MSGFFMQSVNFQAEDIEFSIENETKYWKWIERTINEEEMQLGELGITFASDEYLLKLNQEYLDHDYYTDILTFDYVEEEIVSGDIVISIDRVRENAQDYNVTFEEELNRVIIHGVLHLLGYNDVSDEEKITMRNKENYYLARYSEIE